MNITIAEKPDGKSCEIKIDGRFNIYSVSSIKEKIYNTISFYQSITIDLSGVSEFDTAGVQLLIALKKEMSKTNKSLTMHSHSQHVIALIDLYGLISFFGDKIHIAKENKKDFIFRYGTKKQPGYLY